jgi:hypothetical protein
LEALRAHSGSLVMHAGLVFAVCDRFAGPLAEQARDIRQRLAFDVGLIPPLVL